MRSLILKIIGRLNFANLVALCVFPLVCFTRIIKPIVIVRFGNLGANGIGDFCSAIWDHRAKAYLGLAPKRVLDLSFYSNENWVSNDYLASILLKDTNIYNSKIFYYFWRANRWLPDYKTHDCFQINYNEWPARHSPTFFKYNPSEKKAFMQKLSSNFNIEGEFVCFHSRDDEYKANINTFGRNFDVQNIRNSTFSNYLPAADLLSKIGINSVRLGQFVSGDTPKIFWDYSRSNFRSAENDIKLCAFCKFWVMTTAGISWVPQIYGKPGVACNIIPFTPEMLWHYPRGTVVLPKHFRTPAGDYLTPEKIISHQNVNQDEVKYYNRYIKEEGLTPEENSKEEILDAVNEFIDIIILKKRRNNRFEQKKFWKKIYPNDAEELSQHIIVSPSYLNKTKGI